MTVAGSDVVAAVNFAGEPVERTCSVRRSPCDGSTPRPFEDFSDSTLLASMTSEDSFADVKASG